jgi:hypothetical protein
MTLYEMADWLDQHRPSAAQLKVSPEYNQAVIRTLEWVSAEIRLWAAHDMVLKKHEEA